MAEKVTCPICGKESTRNGLQLHNKMVHGGDIALVIKRVADLEAELADVKAGKTIPNPLPAPAARSEQADPALAVLSDADRLAVLGDWLDGLTKEAWVKIGDEAGFWDEAPVEPATTAADLGDAGVSAPPRPPEPAPVRRVYFPSSGIIATIRTEAR